MATGSVKWFSSEKGFGFIIPDEGEGDVFVHYTGIKGDGYRNLEEGQRVTFEVAQSEKGLMASEVEAVEGENISVPAGAVAEEG